MTDKLVQHVLSRKVRPAHPGEIVSDILDDYSITKNELCEGNTQWLEMLDGERPITNSFIVEVHRIFGISSQLLMNLQRKVDIWGSARE